MPFALTLPQMRELVKLLNAHQLEPDAVGLLDFMQRVLNLGSWPNLNLLAIYQMCWP